MPRKPVRKLEVSAATAQSGKSAPRQLERFSGLVVEFEDGSKKLLALGHPKDWLLALAHELRGYVGGGPVSAASVPVEVVEKSLREEDDDVPEQPADSRVQVEERVAGVRLVAPPPASGADRRGCSSLRWCGAGSWASSPR